MPHALPQTLWIEFPSHHFVPKSQGHTLQGNYEGAFVYAKEPVLPEAAKPAVREAAAKAGLDFDAFTPIDNTCPAGNSLNDAQAGTGTSTTDWIDLVIGEGGVIGKSYDALARVVNEFKEISLTLCCWNLLR